VNITHSIPTALESGTVQLFKARYPVIVLFLLVRYGLYATLGAWSEDFWEHSAVVRELMTHPWHPKHPQILVNAPHVFFSPYSLLVALFASSFHLDSITSLAIFGGINLLLLSFGLFRFCDVYFGKTCSTVASYTLLLSLFLWGQEPWLFSGFYNFQVFNEVLPYPSTFSLGLSLLALSINRKSHFSSVVRTNFVVLCMASVVLITHSLTAIFLIMGVGCQHLASRKLNLVSIFTLSGLILGALILALYWPYFSMWQLIITEGSSFDFANKVMYLNVVNRIWPTLVLSPVIIWQALKRKNRDLALMLTGLTAIYCFGYLLNKYSYGRTITFVMLISNLLLAQTITEIENALIKTRLISVYKTIWALTLTAVLLIWLAHSTKRLLTVFNSIYLGRTVSSQITYGNLQFLKKYTEPYDLIFADVDSSWIIPSISGKAIGTDHPLAFVPDWYVRKWDLMQFYSTALDATDRQRILEKYRPRFLLIKKSLGDIATKVMQEFSDVNKYQKLFEDEKFVLIRLL